MGYDFAMTVRGPRKVVRLFGERRSNGVSELFVHCTGMSETKFVTTKRSDAAVRLRGRNGIRGKQQAL